MDIIYCSKCKKNAASTNVETVKQLTTNGGWKQSMCKVCGHEKSTFVKVPEASEVVKDVKPLTSKETLIEAEELHKPVIKKFLKRKIVTLGIGDLWAANLVIMDKYVMENDG